MRERCPGCGKDAELHAEFGRGRCEPCHNWSRLHAGLDKHEADLLFPFTLHIKMTELSLRIETDSLPLFHSVSGETVAEALARAKHVIDIRWQKTLYNLQEKLKGL